MASQVSFTASNVHVCLFEQRVGFSYNSRPSISTKGVMGPLSRAEENRWSWGQKTAGRPPPKYPILVTPPARPGLNNRFHAVWGGRLRADCVCGGGWEVGGRHWKVLNDSEMVGLMQDNASVIPFSTITSFYPFALFQSSALFLSLPLCSSQGSLIMRMGESDEKERERQGTKTKDIESGQRSRMYRVCHVCKSKKLNTHECLNMEIHMQWLKSVTLDTCLGLLWWMQEGQGLGIPKWWAQLLFLSRPFQRSHGRVWGPARLTVGSKGHLWVSS